MVYLQNIISNPIQWKFCFNGTFYEFALHCRFWNFGHIHSTSGILHQPHHYNQESASLFHCWYIYLVPKNHVVGEFHFLSKLRNKVDLSRTKRQYSLNFLWKNWLICHIKRLNIATMSLFFFKYRIKIFLGKCSVLKIKAKNPSCL